MPKDRPYVSDKVGTTSEQRVPKGFKKQAQSARLNIDEMRWQNPYKKEKPLPSATKKSIRAERIRIKAAEKGVKVGPKEASNRAAISRIRGRKQETGTERLRRLGWRGTPESKTKAAKQIAKSKRVGSMKRYGKPTSPNVGFSRLSKVAKGLGKGMKVFTPISIIQGAIDWKAQGGPSATELLGIKKYKRLPKVKYGGQEM